MRARRLSKNMKLKQLSGSNLEVQVYIAQNRRITPSMDKSSYQL